MSGAVIRLAVGGERVRAEHQQVPVRSTSGIGTESGAPNISADEISFGSWSTVLAEKTLRVPSALSSTRP